MRRIGPIKVLIVDDSPLVRSILTRVLAEADDIAVVGGATDPYDARDMIIKHKPNVIILDVIMPRMDGIAFLKKLRVHYPVPVIICSSAASSNGALALEAIEQGAVDVLAKPRAGGRGALKRLGEDLAEKVRAAAVAMPAAPPIPASATAKPASFSAAGVDPKRYLVAIGASTGGTEAIKSLLAAVPADFPPVTIVQHMPEEFTKSFAQRLDSYSALEVTEAVDGDVLLPGRAFVARGGIQMRVRIAAGSWKIAYGSSELVNRHCPSVDVLFDSVASTFGKRAVGILLTGMGADGARGLLSMRQAGALTATQTKESCVVYGMPKVAYEMGASQITGTPSEIPQLVLSALRKDRTSRAVGTAR